MQLYSTAMLKCYKHFKMLTLNFSSCHFRYYCPTRSSSWTSFITLILSLPDHTDLLASEPLHWLFPLSVNTLPPESHMAPSFSFKSLFKCHFLNERYPDNPNEKGTPPLPPHSWSLLFCSITLQLQWNLIPRLTTTFWIHTETPARTSPNFHKHTAVILQGNITFIILCSPDKI